jgi:hypothetical protein
MSTKVTIVKSPPVAPELAPFGPPPLIEGDDSAAYDELLARVSTAVKPVNILEDIWVRDFVDLDWEVSRLRRLKVSLMAATARKGLRTVLDGLTFRGSPRDLVEGWVARKPSAIKRVNRILAAAGLTIDAAMAATLRDNLNYIDRIERLTTNAEARRNGALREIELHRATLACRLRRAVPQIEDDKYQAIEAEAAERKSVA